METVAIGGLMAEAFKLFLGNPDIAVALVAFTIFFGSIFTIIRTYMDFTDTD